MKLVFSFFDLLINVNSTLFFADRLAGATLIAPVINYWWSGLPTNLSTEGFKTQLLWDKWSLRVAHYAPWLTYWWNTQKLFPPLCVIAQSPEMLSRQDKELIPNFPAKELMVRSSLWAGFRSRFHHCLVTRWTKSKVTAALDI